jgi:hypothetical protein
VINARAQRAADGQRSVREVHVAPGECEQFAESQAGVGGHADSLGILVILRCAPQDDRDVARFERTDQRLDLLDAVVRQDGRVGLTAPVGARGRIVSEVRGRDDRS